MRLSTHTALAATALMAGLLFNPAAQAASFAMLAQTRSVAMNGQIQLYDYDTGESFSATAAPAAQTRPGDFGRFDASVGLGSLVLDQPQGGGQGAGRAAQVSTFEAEAIRFDGAADVFLSGSVSTNAVITGSGNAASRLNGRFAVARATRVLLAMDSEIGPRNNQYSFSLARDDGSVLWDQTVLYDDTLGEVRHFTQALLLTPGSYVLDTALTASSYFQDDFGVSGRVLAQFSITPVPEPASLVLWLGGLAGLAGMRRQLFSHPSASGTPAPRARAARGT